MRNHRPVAWLAILLPAALSLAAPLAAAELLVGNHEPPAGASILRFDSTSGAPLGVLVATGSGGLVGPGAMAIGPGGQLYVADTFNDAVRRYDGTTGASLGDLVPPGAGGLSEPLDLVFGPDGKLYVASCGSDSVLRYDGGSGAFLGTFVPAGSGGLNCSAGLAFGPTGDLFVTSMDTASVLRYDGTSGSFLGIFVPSNSGGLTGAGRLRFGPDGNLYMSSGGADRVLRYSGTSGAFLGAFVSAAEGAPDDFTFGPDGNLYGSTFQPGGAILKFRGTDGAPLGAFVPPGSGGLDKPGALLFRTATGCPSSPTVLCLDGDRFQVEADWRTGQGDTGAGQAVELTDDTGYFWFFAASNVEVVVKVLDACAPPFERFWVFAAGLTDVEVELTVTDTETNEVKTYRNPLGRRFRPVQDTQAFATCP